MVRRVLMPAMLIATIAILNVAQAEEAKKAKEECSECPIAKAMKDLPQITFLVGEEKTTCSTTAGKLAKAHSTPIVYLVGKEKFEDANKAKLALVTATEEFVAEFASPKVCKVSGTTTIAGQKTECSESAAKLTGLLAAAMKNVNMSYAVGEEECNCPVAAAALAKSSGEPKLFVVGKEKTECEVTARLNLARAQYHAMIEAMVKAEKKSESTEKDS